MEALAFHSIVTTAAASANPTLLDHVSIDDVGQWRREPGVPT